MWKCKCVCGVLSTVATTSLTNGTSKSCGCLRNNLRRGKIGSLIGAKFGRLTVVKQSSDVAVAGRIYITWLCSCACGRKHVVRGEPLRAGRVKSCGCLHKEKCSLRRKRYLIGKRFGRLTVIARKHLAKDQFWLCKCKCGKTIEVTTGSLKSNNTRSCGCLKSDRLRQFNQQLRTKSMRIMSNQLRWMHKHRETKP